MILQPCNVELTKVHYYDQTKRSHNMGISTISREMHENDFNKNMMIKKNIFGHRWVLKINEQQNNDLKSKIQRKYLTLYIIVVFCIIVAVSFGIIFSIDHDIFKHINNTHIRNILVNDSIDIRTKIFLSDVNDDLTSKESLQTKQILPFSDKYSIERRNRIELLNIARSKYCPDCSTEDVCLKIEEVERPRCLPKVDKKDPTGCGGYCKINKEYCKLLDKGLAVFQCLPLKNLLKCPESTFNCGNMCISVTKRCDGRIDCLNMEDEINCDCNLDDNFQCGNKTSCLHKSKVCNGKVDCWDKSDEIHCQTDIFCEANHVPCLNGQCIPKEKMCDRVFDCVDKTDEPIWCQEIKH
ncbi:uncharacterized protein LOC126747627 [Anthonomus grandis grandis]|uniref:uncharacterized protein LOC126747627 n=1 Tax=Anthonomus grandis grandis TaxID=2921223 RepID=UPI0021667BE3|nr:uncharacterized protein LOC126747627 [Anthonomus grandis grandis]